MPLKPTNRNAPLRPIDWVYGILFVLAFPLAVGLADLLAELL